MRRVALALAVAFLVAGCGGGETVAPAPETVIGTVPQGETETVPVEEGDPDAGKVVFTDEAQPTCGSCHAYEAAGTTAMVGPDLDGALQGQDAQQILQSILDPDADIAEGFAPGIMPKDYGQKLSEKQLADLVAFLLPQS